MMIIVGVVLGVVFGGWIVFQSLKCMAFKRGGTRCPNRVVWWLYNRSPMLRRVTRWAFD